MGNRKTKTQGDQDEEEVILSVNDLLGDAINLEQLFDKDPTAFNLSLLPVRKKIALLKADAKKFLPHIDVTALNPFDKAEVVLRLKNKGIVKQITFTEEELAKVPLGLYGQMVQKDFSYIRKDLYGKMLKGDQAEVFLSQPAWVMANADKPPRLTKEKLGQLAYRNPGFIDVYISDFSQYSTGDTFWRKMIEHDEKYKEIFMRNTKSCTTKTEVRAVVWRYPELIKMLDGDILADSKLTCKEWLLFASSVMGSNEDKFKDWEFSEEVRELFRMDLMAELLNGKSTLTKRFQNAMKGVFGNEEEEQENEDTTLVGSTP